MKISLWILALTLIVSTAYGKSLYTIDGKSVIVDLEGIGVKSRMLKVEVWTDKTVKIISGMEKEFSSFQSYLPQLTLPPVKFKVAYAQNNIEVTTRDLIVSIQEDGLVRIFNRDGNKLLIESDRFFESSESNEAKFKIKQRYFLNVHENVYGFGFDESGPRYNIRGKMFETKQDLSSIATPVMFSEKGYAIIWDNYSHTTFNDQKSGLEISSELADEIQYFFMYGPTWDEIIAEIRQLTGSVPMLPRWAFGHWGFPDFYSDVSALEMKAAQYNSLGLPTETLTTKDISIFNEEKSFLDIGVQKRLSCIPAYASMKKNYLEYAKTAYNRRLCIPTYINYPGIQAYGTFLIAGEGNLSWNSLKNQVSAGINLSLSGQPYWSTIIGGSQDFNSANNFDNELLTRWYQFAAFSPIFLLPKPDRDFLSIKQNNYKEALIKAINLRYHLMPYIYTTAAGVSFSNKTFTKSLLFEFQKEEKSHTVDQQYLFGESMMICPVTAPATNSMTLYFPAGFVWYDFFTGKQYSGDDIKPVEVSPENIPVFVKGGSIIPFASIGGNAGDSLSSPMEIRVYPGRNCKFTLYEDANDGQGYRSEQFSKIPFEYIEKDRSFSVGSIEGNTTDMIKDRIFRIVMVTDSTGIGSEMSSLYKEVVYKGKKVKIKL